MNVDRNYSYLQTNLWSSRYCIPEQEYRRLEFCAIKMWFNKPPSSGESTNSQSSVSFQEVKFHLVHRAVQWAWSKPCRDITQFKISWMKDIVGWVWEPSNIIEFLIRRSVTDMWIISIKASKVCSRPPVFMQIFLYICHCEDGQSDLVLRLLKRI